MTKNKNKAPAPWELLFTSDQLSEDIQALFDDETIETITDYLETAPDDSAIRSCVEQAVRAYLMERQKEKIRHPAKLETMRLLRAAEAADKLTKAMTPIRRYGNTAEKVYHYTQRGLEDRDTVGANALKKLENNSGPGLRFDQLQGLVEELANALAAAAIIERGEMVNNRRNYSLEIYDKEMQQNWNRDRRLRDSRCFDAAVHEIAEMWSQYNSASFTEGKHDKDIGRTNSKTADLVHTILSRIDPKVTRQRATTIVRKYRTNEYGRNKSSNFPT